MTQSAAKAATYLLFLNFLFRSGGEDDNAETVELIRQRDSVLAKSNSIPNYRPALERMRGELTAAEAGAQPVAESKLEDDMAKTDGVHDGFGGALFHLGEALLRCPGASARTRETALRIHADLVSSLGELRQKYAKEAVAAQKRRPKLDAMAEELQALTLPDGMTALDWAEGYIGAGEKLQRQLRDQALRDAAASAPSEDEEESPSSSLLRLRAMRLINRCRAALADELLYNNVSGLPANADALVFGYLDKLVAEAAEPAKPAKAATSPTPATPVVEV